MAQNLRQKSIHEKLTEIANNLWWSWQPEVTGIFREIDPAMEWLTSYVLN